MLKYITTIMTLCVYHKKELELYKCQSHAHHMTSIYSNKHLIIHDYVIVCPPTHTHNEVTILDNEDRK